MSPLEITLLLNLYCRKYPMQDYPRAQATSPAMHQAFSDFRQSGLLEEGVTLQDLLGGMCLPQYLSLKGEALVEKLKAIEP